MTSASWRYAFARAVGTSHDSGGEPCQDAGHAEVIDDEDGDPVFVGVVADGAGSARHAADGSRIVVHSIVEGLRAHFAAGQRTASISNEVALGLVGAARAALVAEAAVANADVREFACTAVVAVVAEDVSVFFQVGDGVIVVGARGHDAFDWVFWPERGEYANTTVFVSDVDVSGHLVHTILPGAVDEVAVMTDGLQGLVLDLKAKTAHLPFFKVMFAPLRDVEPDPATRDAAADGRGFMKMLSGDLEGYLSSPRVNSRTDDDKTLILASRRRAASAS